MAGTTKPETDLTEAQIRAAAEALGLTVRAAKSERSRPAPFGDEDSDRLTWIAAHARPALSPCLCGCGEMTKGRFAPGHDAILKSRLSQTPGQQARDIETAMGWPAKEPVADEAETEAS